MWTGFTNNFIYFRYKFIKQLLARHNLMDAKCRWRSDRIDGTNFQGTPWSNQSDANLPGGDTKPPWGNNP